MMKMHSIAILILVLTLSTSCNTITKKNTSDDIRTAKFDSLLTYCHVHGMFNGSIAVIKNDTIQFQKSYGLTNQDFKKNINTETLFYIASVSKQFTALGIMMLQEKGQLSYDDPVQKYLPELTSLNKSTTIRHLLHHTSGISDRMYYQLEKPSNLDVFNLIKSQKPSEFSNPNQVFAYSNTGYLLLAFIIEKVSGTSIQKFYKNEIFEPLDMNRTTTFNKELSADNNIVQAYNILGKKDNSESIVIGPTGIYSTINDLIKWNTSLNENTLVTPHSLDLAFSGGTIESGKIMIKMFNHDYGYGFGWMSTKKGSSEIVQHDGSTQGYRSLIKKNLSNNFDVILLTNHGSSLAMEEITNALDEIIENLDYKTPEIPLPNRIINLLKTKDIHKVIEEIRISINETNTPEERTLGILGITFKNQKMTKEAIAVFELNLELYPKSADALYVLAEAYFSEEQYESAKKIYTKYLELNPKNEFVKKKLEQIN